MASVCLYFQVHQPFRILPFTFFDIGNDSPYFNDVQNRQIINKVADNCYLPSNKLLLELIQESKGQFKVAFSISGVAMEQFSIWRPDVLDSFRALSQTGCVEFLAETYYHSLSSIFSPSEFERQVKLHSEIMKREFDTQTKVFRNTELIYWDGLVPLVNKLGYKTILTEGWDKYLENRSPHHVFEDPTGQASLLLKDYQLSDDIAFRFSDVKGKNYPLTGKKYADSLLEKIENSGSINLFMDYETFGEHHGSESGIFELLRTFPMEILQSGTFTFKTPSEIVSETKVTGGVYQVPDYLSWADTERDLSAWQGNAMQREAAEFLFSLEEKIIERPELLDDWSKLQTSDHFYYMSTKGYGDGAVHNYFNAFRTPYDANIYYMNILSDLELRLRN